jgi:Double zinc ribbon
MPWARRRRAEPPPEAVPTEPPETGDVVEERVANGAPPLEPVPHPRRLRNERRSLLRRREIEIRDVGGLTIEMVRRDRFRPELLIERAGDVLQLERRMHELDSLLFATTAAPGGLAGTTRCQCGAPLLVGSHFCSHCGRPVPNAHVVRACRHCGQPLPAGVNFCAFCGNSVVADEFQPGLEPLDDTFVARWSPPEEPRKED